MQCAPSIVHDVLRSPGAPLDADTRAFMEPRFGHDFSRVRVHCGSRVTARSDARLGGEGQVSFRLAEREHPRLPAGTPAWTENGIVHLGPAGVWMPAVERRRILQHEALHSVQQQLAPRDESAAARERAETLGSRFERGVQVPTFGDLHSPVPGLLAYPPQAYSPWDRVWIGHAGLIGEVTASGVTVRIFRFYDEIGIQERPEYRSYECGKHDAPPIPDLVKKMKEVAAKTAELNTKIPATATGQRVALVAIFGDPSGSGYRVANGKGMIVLSATEFEAGTWAGTIAHEGAHAIFEYHSVHLGPEKRTPDPFALRIADLYEKLRDTKAVAEPTGKFDPKSPPPLKIVEDRSAHPAGLTMVMDMLWAGSGGHPWHGVDEFFASAYSGFLLEPKLLQQIIKHYQKADPKIGPLAKELISLLKLVGKPKPLAKVKPPASPAAAESALGAVGAAPDFSNKTDIVGWLVDPSRMPGPDRIVCPSAEPEKSRSIEEILGEEPSESLEDILHELERTP